MLNVLNALTGATTRHNRVLVEMTDLLKALEEFVSKYGNPEDVFNNIGEARVDITAIMYNIRKRRRIPASISRERIRPLVREIYDDLEQVRVDIFNLKKGKFSLSEDLSKLNTAFQALAGAVSNLEYR